MLSFLGFRIIERVFLTFWLQGEQLQDFYHVYNCNVFLPTTYFKESQKFQQHPSTLSVDLLDYYEIFSFLIIY